MLTLVDPKVDLYCVKNSSIPSLVCQEILDFTYQNIPMAQMVSGPLECSLIGLLLRSLGAKRVVELGTFTGYSALAMAEQLPEGGEVVTIDINADTTALANGFWSKSPHGKKIRPVVGAAEEVLRGLPKSYYDLAFLDIDKRNYPKYLQLLLALVRPSGVVVVDNTLWSGRVLDPSVRDPDTEGIRQMTAEVVAREDLYVTLVPVRDGILLVHKKS